MNWLRPLAEHDRGLEAPPELEGRLVAAFRRRKMRRRAIAWGAGAVAAGIAAALPLLLALPGVSLPKIRVAPPGPPASEAVQRPVEKVQQSPQPAREIVTEFFPLMNPAPPFERGELLRVEVPASVMRTVGLPVREERSGDLIQADVLVGEEGIPRAIRFVSFDSK